jgi:hypothetical protein
MNITLHIIILLISFSIAFLGVITFINFDFIIGGLMTIGGLILFINSIARY